MVEQEKRDRAEREQHRGRIQAQGGGTEKSVAWAQEEPPTESEMLEKCDLLEEKLTPNEREDRAKPLDDLRRFIRVAAAAGGLCASPKPFKKSFGLRGGAGIRIDLEVIKGLACVPDPKHEEASQ